MYVHTLDLEPVLFLMTMYQRSKQTFQYTQESWTERSLSPGGGLEIDTVYGVYKVCLSPNTEGDYMEITCSGLPVLTERFTEYSLEELNEEVYNLGTVERSLHLPKTLGGAPVGLLIGITTTKTDPILIHTLPNGLGIYQTPFIDWYGSQLAKGAHIRFFSRGVP